MPKKPDPSVTSLTWKDIPGKKAQEKICTFFGIQSIHLLRGHMVLIQTKHFEQSHQIEIVTHYKKTPGQEEQVTLLLPAGLLCITLEHMNIRVSKLITKMKTIETIPCTSVTFFFGEKKIQVPVV